MTMDPNILIAYGAAVQKYKKHAIIFRQDEMARFYFQVLEGEVKTYNVNHNTKEFVQGIFGAGESFGEPALFVRDVHPVNAIAIRQSVILKLSGDVFFTLLAEYPDIQRIMLDHFARQMYDHAVSVRMLNNDAPEFRILDFLTTYKKKAEGGEDRILVHFTRQEIANQTGLRVETVIRALAKLRDQQKVEIINRKLYF